MYLEPPNPFVMGTIALVLVGIAVAVYFVTVRKAGALKKVGDEIVEGRPERLRKMLWDPMLRELGEVVASEGEVADPKSEWARISAFARRESGTKFQHGMDEYVRQRRRVADLAEGLPQTGPVSAEVEAERTKLVETAEELLQQVHAALQSQPPTPAPAVDIRNQAPTWKKYEGL